MLIYIISGQIIKLSKVKELLQDQNKYEKQLFESLHRKLIRS
jgi:hypothetical protein